MINAVSVAIAVGLIGGACFGYFLSKALAFRLSRLSPSPRIVIACAGAGALLMLFPAFFLCFAVGGSLGGAWGEAAGSRIGLGSVGAPFGLAAGIAAVLGGVPVLGTLLGGLLGRVLARLLPKSTLR
jgi:hypothetical protein